MAINDENDTVFEGLGKGVVNYSQILMMHMDRIAKCSAQPIYEDKTAEDAFKSGIKGLQSILSPYLDDEYFKKRKELGIIDENDKYYELWSLLVQQLKKANLLPAERTQLYDNDGESDYLMA